MRVFITDLGSSLSTELARNCQDAGLEVVGTASRGGKSEVTAIKRQLQSHASSDVAGAVKEPIALQTDVAAWRRLVQQADVVVVTSLAADPKLAMETLKVFEKRDMTKGDDEAKEDEGGESVKRFIAVSSVLSWSKNSPFAASGTDSGHVEDDFNLAVTTPKKYLLAVDRASGSTSLRDVCRGVSTLLASGHLRDREDSASAADAKADALLLDEEEELVTPLQVHLRFDTSAGAMHTLVAPEEWRHYSRGLLGNLVFFFDDFINAMDLRPLRTIILGAPRAGKTMLSRKLAADYYLPYLSPTALLRELFASDKPKANQPDPTRQQGNEDTQKLREELQQWAPTAGDKASQLPEKALVALVRWKLRSAACRNQGYVLDGLPISSVQAKKIFSQEPNTDTNVVEGGESGEPGEMATSNSVDGADTGEAANEDENADGAAAVPAVDVEAMLTHLKPRQLVEVPNRVIVLQAPRALLEIRAQALSEAEAERTENTQDAFARRFDEFESNIEALEAFFEKPKMTKEVTAEGVEVLELSLRDEHGYRNDAVFAAPIQRYVEQGDQAPRNFHPTRAELREQRRAAEKQARAAVFRSAQLIREQDAQDEAAQQAKIARERARLELLQCEEAELLETRAKPLRTYLMDTVLPALTEGMLEVVKVQPTDPIDYLAEFLFRKGQELEAELSEA
ncbi:hypothetical protein PInf_001103 [Phytophthora infestans]|nr:hypothetical protein PInf_001103 [Phytophthora infestans]